MDTNELKSLLVRYLTALNETFDIEVVNDHVYIGNEWDHLDQHYLVIKKYGITIYPFMIEAAMPDMILAPGWRVDVTVSRMQDGMYDADATTVIEEVNPTKVCTGVVRLILDIKMKNVHDEIATDAMVNEMHHTFGGT